MACPENGKLVTPKAEWSQEVIREFTISISELLLVVFVVAVVAAVYILLRK